MLRINLLHDAAHDERPSGGSALLYLVGGLVLALCAFIGLAGWLTAQASLNSARAEQSSSEAQLAALADRVPPPADFTDLIALEQSVLDLSALAEHQALRPVALNVALVALDFDVKRDNEIALGSLRFDGQTLHASGRARDIRVLEQVLTALQADKSLTDARFTVLRAADEPLSGKPRRDRLSAIDFELYAAIPAPPLSVQE